MGKAIARRSGWSSLVQTACAEFWGSFSKEGRNTFTITANAGIYLRHEIVTGGWYPDTRIHMGTYSISYEVEFDIGTRNITVNAEDLGGVSLKTGDVYFDNKLAGYTWVTHEVEKDSIHEIFVNDFWEKGRTGNRFAFQYWEGGLTDNPRTVVCDQHKTIIAYFKRKYCPYDVNNYGKVTITDIVIIALSYGSERKICEVFDPPNHIWNSLADVTGDDKVTISDVSLASLYLGCEYP